MRPSPVAIAAACIATLITTPACAQTAEEAARFIDKTLGNGTASVSYLLDNDGSFQSGSHVAQASATDGCVTVLNLGREGSVRIAWKNFIIAKPYYAAAPERTDNVWLSVSLIGLPNMVGLWIRFGSPELGARFIKAATFYGNYCNPKTGSF